MKQLLIVQALESAIASKDARRVEQVIEENELANRLNEIDLKYQQPILAAAPNVEFAKRLIEAGADVDRVAKWWKPGFFVIDRVVPEVGEFLIDSGAEVSPHALAALGLVDRLAGLISDDTQIVNQPGGDGATPLHFARDDKTVKLLIDNGANLDARDIDHESTPAQWLVKNNPQGVRYLFQQGATPDIFVAAALGEHKICETLVADSDGRCLSSRVGRDSFPPIGYKGRGGTILQWTLGFNSFAHQYALAAGQRDLYEYLYDQSDVQTKFLVSCLTANRDAASKIKNENPDIISQLDETDLQLLPIYCWETNASCAAVKLMLDLGFPIDTRERQHGHSALHNAAFGGYGDLVRLLLERGFPVDVRDTQHNSTPLDWAMHCCLHDGRHPEADYETVVGFLIDAGSPWDPSVYPTGNEKIDAALKPRLDSVT